MKVALSEYAGFCPGVKRADITVRRLIAERDKGERIYTLGHLIHNPQYNAELEALGVHSIEIGELEALFPSSAKITVVIRTHGVTKEVRQTLAEYESKYENFKVVDVTCIDVKKIQSIAENETSDNTVFILFCEKNHPEALGIMSRAKGEKYAVSSLEELKTMEFKQKLPILCSQTTQNLLEFEKIKIFLKKLYTNAKIYDTICSVTENRQNEAVKIASESDCMVIVGGRESSNTKRLYDLCLGVCPRTVHIETAKELNKHFFDSAKSAGLTAGASTPDGIITEVLKVMEEIKTNEFSELLEDSLKTLHTGETVIGTVFTISENEIKLDLGAKFTGVLTKEQITDDPAAKLSDMFKIGEEIEVFVIRVEDGKGIATVSKKRVDADNSWVVLKDAYENGEILEGKVVSLNKGGVVVSAKNNSVFVPASQTGIAKGEDLSALVGTEQKIKLIEFDVQRKKALGSIKVVLNEERKAREDAIWATLEVGKHYMGTVKNLTAYGAFVDIGGVDGMVHNTELSWKRIKHPSQVVSVGQEIDVFIKELDEEKRRISLGYKTQEMDNWFQFTQKYNEGDVVPAKIVSLMPFGAFAEVYEGVDGLIHVSRISTERVNSPADVLKVGDVVDVKITEIDDENRKLALSIRALKEEEERAAREAARAEEEAAAAAAAAEEEARIAQERADMAPYIVGSI